MNFNWRQLEKTRIKLTDLELTYCCREVLQTATKAEMKPLALTLTSVTVQTPTPNRTNTMLSLVSREYRTLSRTTSRKQDTGIILNFAIWKTNEANSLLWSDKLKTTYNRVFLLKILAYLIKPHRIPHQAHIHSDNGKVCKNNKYQNVWKWKLWWLNITQPAKRRSHQSGG